MSCFLRVGSLGNEQKHTKAPWTHFGRSTVMALLGPVVGELWRMISLVYELSSENGKFG